MLQEYKARDGQSAYDVCMILYGSLDYLVKLLVDSGIENADTSDFSGVVFMYDPELVSNQAIQTFLTKDNRGTNYVPEP